MPRLADKGLYLACESTFYRILRRSGEVHRRGRQSRRQKVSAPTTFTATAPCQVWSWDITGYEVHERESGEQAAALKSQTLQMKLYELNITPSHSRPRVSNDNAYAESLFRTLKYVTPGERHRGEDRVLLEKRDALHREAQKARPERWSGKTRNWQAQGPVILNPEREKQAA